MTWLKLDDRYADHPKIVTAGPDAAWLDLCGMLYCARYLTDGFIPAGQVRKLTGHPSPDELARVLVRVGRWEQAAGGYLVHDYLDYNPSRAQVLAEREQAARRQAGFRNKRRGADGRYTAGRNAVTHAVTHPDPVPDPVPVPQPVPDPSSSTAGRAVEHTRTRVPGGRAEEDVLLLLLDALVADRGMHPTAAARQVGCDPDAPAVETARLAASLCDAGVERDVALDLALTRPGATATWLDHPEWWEKARNPAGLLVSRIRAAPERRSA